MLLRYMHIFARFGTGELQNPAGVTLLEISWQLRECKPHCNYTCLTVFDVFKLKENCGFCPFPDQDYMYSTEVWNCDRFECGPSLLSSRHSSVLASRLSGLGSSPSWGHFVVFLGKTLYFQCLSPPRCINGYCQI